MAMFSVKIGEIHLQSEEPISPEQRDRAIAELDAASDLKIATTSDGLDVVGLVNVETVRLTRRC